MPVTTDRISAFCQPHSHRDHSRAAEPVINGNLIPQPSLFSTVMCIAVDKQTSANMQQKTLLMSMMPPVGRGARGGEPSYPDGRDAELLQPLESLRRLPAFCFHDGHHEILPTEHLQRAEQHEGHQYGAGICGDMRDIERGTAWANGS